MKCRILFFEENRTNIINLSSTELAQRVEKVNVSGGTYVHYGLAPRL